MKRVVIGVSGLLFCALCHLAASAASTEVQARSSSADRPLHVSLIQLIARPGDFNGEYVRVAGFYRHEFEGNALYLHREDYEQGLTKNGLWMHGKPEYNLTYVLVEGRFNAKRLGHMDLWSGEIGAITRLVPWPPKDGTTKD
jgi:hypothetical protein